MLTYLLTQEDLTPEEVNGHTIEVVFGGVDTVSKKQLTLQRKISTATEMCYGLQDSSF